MSKEKCTDELIEQACELKAKGFKDKDICECLGIHQSTYCNWKNKPTNKQHLKLIEGLKKAMKQHRLTLIGRIEEASAGDWRAAAWILERTYPDNYAKPEVQLSRQIAKATIENADDELSKSLKELAKEL